MLPQTQTNLSPVLCRDQSHGHSAELSRRSAQHSSHHSCGLSWTPVPPVPHQTAGIQLPFPPPSVSVPLQALQALSVCLCSAQSISTSGFNPCLSLSAALVVHRNKSSLAHSHSKGNKMSFCYEPSLVPEGLSWPALSLDYWLTTPCLEKRVTCCSQFYQSAGSRMGRTVSPSQCEGMQHKLCWLTHTV